MQLHEIQPIHKGANKTRRGRGGKKGTYSGRGMKGQKSRSGTRFQPRIRELIKKYPKLRGYRAKRRVSTMQTINVETLEKNFGEGETVSPRILVEKKIVDTMKGRVPTVKILGRGKLTRAVKIESCIVSSSAKEKIEKAGGSIT